MERAVHEGPPGRARGEPRSGAHVPVRHAGRRARVSGRRGPVSAKADSLGELGARGPQAGVRPTQQRGLGCRRPAHPRACCFARS
eukprot:13232398-Alexandrium_andersonii.AAC.1